MDTLPLEIQHVIADFTCLSTKSLQALSQVNRRWNQVARKLLFQHLFIRLCEETPERLLPLPDSTRVLAHVRRLGLVGKSLQPQTPHPLRDILQQDEGDRFVPRVKFYQGDWCPIINLIRMIPHLQELDILVSDGVHPELLQAVSRYHPTCRLSIFPGYLFWRRGEIPQKYSAVASLLHAVHVRCHENLNCTVFMEHPMRILTDMILLAPNVKHLAMQISGVNAPGDNRDYHRYLGSNPPHERPEGFLRAQLESLSLPPQTKLTAQHFSDLHEATDFGQLRSWTVGCIEDSSVPRTIAHLHPFRQLKRLVLALYPPSEDLRFWPAVESMFESLPPLTYLCLLGAYEPRFLHTAVLRKHGATLLVLKLHKVVQGFNSEEILRLAKKGTVGPIFSAQDISSIAAQCPLLRELSICIQRSRGLETDVYAALAQLPSLDTLHLVVNCLAPMSNQMPVPPRELTDFEQSRLITQWYDMPAWFSRDTMINCAIDATLATAIFRYISRHQPTRRFLRLTLHPLYGQFKQYAHYGQPRDALPVDRELFKELAPIWTVWRDSTGVRARRGRTTRPLDRSIRGEILQIFKSIWPGDPEATKWPLEWKSWPLQNTV
ncbi:hypothetical protein BO78DRAFT_474069 [Aspergillus sclerotiicarbonarius CBS 121057]|uniref:F-box domain-containing protein n=1 Tax=Aspergillus sclerotiicarbonarius (strain CBS 121057 / IBT 28362) TaxID=1448318 RepID=A0A319E1H8_ASPSB|nr:hypothetical protein BO78DRAFT_474069 [Aspergillus sclerotiicarbonarius CBS 121057]